MNQRKIVQAWGMGVQVQSSAMSSDCGRAMNLSKSQFSHLQIGVMTLPTCLVGRLSWDKVPEKKVLSAQLSDSLRPHGL